MTINRGFEAAEKLRRRRATGLRGLFTRTRYGHAVSATQSIPVTVRATVRQPAAGLRTALRDELEHLERAHAVALEVDLPLELQTPVEAALSLPARIQVKEEADGQLSLRIAAPGRRFRSFPAFWGVLQVAPWGADAAVVTLHGTYTLPLAALERSVDKTFLRRAAHSSLRGFLENAIQEAVREARHA